MESNVRRSTISKLTLFTFYRKNKFLPVNVMTASKQTGQELSCIRCYKCRMEDK